MTDPHALPDDRRFQAQTDLFDALSKLRVLLSMLHMEGFEHFRALDALRQSEYLETCLHYAEQAYGAFTAWECAGITDDAGPA